MDMRVIQSEKKLCTCCMEEHEVKTVSVHENTIFKNEKVEYEASYLYCDVAEELYADEQKIQENDIRMKDAYRKKCGLLTSSEISCIRSKYGISQSDLCVLLGWGGKTITRYEGHQVQDKAHDAILKKLDKDSEWFLSLLIESKKNLTSEAYRRYFTVATALYEEEHDLYLRKAIEASYARFQGDQCAHGNMPLSLDKTVDIIRYFAASPNVDNLYKLKLMKLMWYADAFSFKKRGTSITGLVYQAMPIGVAPIGYNSIIDLHDVPCEEVEIGEAIVYHFALNERATCKALTHDEKEILDFVIEKLGMLSKNQIGSLMHREEAYIKTKQGDIVSFQYVESLQI